MSALICLVPIITPISADKTRLFKLRQIKWIWIRFLWLSKVSANERRRSILVNIYHVVSTNQSALRLEFTMVVRGVQSKKSDPGPFHWHGLILISTWISYHNHYKVWEEITYPFPNFNGCTILSLWMNKQYTHTIYWACDNFSMLGLKLIHVNKTGPANNVTQLTVPCLTEFNT